MKKNDKNAFTSFILSNHVAYGLVMFASSAINNLFVTFYLQLFMQVSMLPPQVFYLG